MDAQKLKNIVLTAEYAQLQGPLHERLVDIYSGNLNKYVKDAIQAELTPKSYEIASKRIPSINLLERITKKLSKVYTEVPKRTTVDKKEQEMVDLYSETMDIQSVMSNAETLLNLNKQFLLEPYWETVIDAKGIPSKVIKTRVIKASEFCVYSDDENNPNNPTAIVKFMGTDEKLVDIKENTFKKVNIYWVYTKESIFIVDSDAETRSEQPNPYGIIPFVYCTSDQFCLQPSPDTDAFDNALIAPKLLCDLNFATQFQSHSIMYAIDVDTNSLTGSPDSLWSLKSNSDNPNSKPSIGVVSPTVDTPKVISLIEFFISQWLEGKGIKPGSAGNTGSASATSAVSKIVDEADTTQVVQANRIILTKAEKSLWEVVGKMQDTLYTNGNLGYKTGVTIPFKVSVSFPIQQIITNPAESREQLKFQLENKLISFKRALKMAHPDLDEAEIEELQKEIEEEQKAKVIEAQENMINQGANGSDNSLNGEQSPKDNVQDNKDNV